MKECYGYAIEFDPASGALIKLTNKAGEVFRELTPEQLDRALHIRDPRNRNDTMLMPPQHAERVIPLLRRAYDFANDLTTSDSQSRITLDI